MFPVGGIGVMLAGAAAALLPCGVLACLLARRTGWVHAIAVAGFLWSLAVIALVTLIPPYGAPGVVLAESRLPFCSREIGGPAPEGFGVFGSDQRLLNTLLFLPSGVLLAVAAMRRPAWAVLTVPLGLGFLALYSAAIELVQFELARIDRACDLTDLVDNVTGAVIGAVIGLGLALVLRPWRHR
ncbi:MAG TPA: VanZ family protein [Nocardioides sp.]|nr:VanZ family protein [Nocardioides sp.]